MLYSCCGLKLRSTRAGPDRWSRWEEQLGWLEVRLQQIAAVIGCRLSDELGAASNHREQATQGDWGQTDHSSQ